MERARTENQQLTASAAREAGVLSRASSVLKLGSIASVAVLAFSALSTDQPGSPERAQANGTPQTQAVTTPGSLSQQADSLVAAAALAWSNKQLPDGRFVDPVLGPQSNYGAPMIGQAMVKTGQAIENPQLIAAGLTAEVKQIINQNGEYFSSGFESFGLTDAYEWNQTHLSENPDWQSAREPIVRYLNLRSKPAPVKHSKAGVDNCLTSDKCWSNLKLVGAFENLGIRSAGLGNNLVVKSASSNTEKGMLTPELQSLYDQAGRNTSTNAARKGGMNFSEAGILSDPSSNPLAYNSLSAMLMGRTMEKLGPNNTSPVIKKTFFRSARALLGLMAPDGDSAYIGRGQGQVWTAAAAADSLAMAAQNSPDPTWRGRFLSGAARAIKRLETLHKPGAWGLPLVPRHSGMNTFNYQGVDSYANTVIYNGLALWALDHAAKVLKTIPETSMQPIPADVNGVFVDPTQTQFAAVTNPNASIWYAVHAGLTHAKDARYDFGTVAAQKRTSDGSWKMAMPPRPYTKQKTSAGPTIESQGKKLTPAGTITANKLGVVTVKGGWTANPNKPATLDLGTTWKFTPERDGVTMAFPSRNNRAYTFAVWHEKGAKVIQNSRGLQVTEQDGDVQKYTFNRPVKITTRNAKESSAYNENMGKSSITVNGNGRQIKYKTSFK